MSLNYGDVNSLCNSSNVAFERTDEPLDVRGKEEATEKCEVNLAPLYHEEVIKDENDFLPAEMFVETEFEVVEDCPTVILFREDHIFQNKEKFQKDSEDSRRSNCSLTIGNGKPPEKRPFVCSICNKCFSRKAFLEGHIRVHTGERPYSCEFCHSAFNDKSNLRKHTRIHFKLPSVTVDCEICKKTFFDISTLRKHARLHAGIKPYVCEICGKSFSIKNSLDKHFRIHTREQPFTCRICFKSFTTSTGMSIHMRLHTGYRPFSCDICTKSFTQKIILKKHIQSHMK